MNKNSFSKWITLSINTIVFLVVQYILGCATFSFQHHPIFILFFASEMYILTRYLNFLIDTLSKKSLAYTIFIVTFLLYYAYSFSLEYSLYLLICKKYEGGYMP